MRNLRVLTALMALFFAGVVSVPAQNRTVAVAPMQFRGLMPVIEAKLGIAFFHSAPAIGPILVLPWKRFGGGIRARFL